MVFKGRFFSSKKSDSSSPDGSNSPRSFGSNSPSRSEKKKVKSTKDDHQIGTSGFVAPCGKTQVKESGKQLKKDVKGKEAPAPAPVKANHLSPKLRTVPDVKEAAPSSSAAAAAAAVSPILASSLGLHRIKTTRSGPLPQESFFGFRGDKGSGLGASNLSRPSGGIVGAGNGDGCLSSGSGSKSSGKKKEVINQSRVGSREQVLSGNWADTGINSDAMSSESTPSRDQSPHVQVRSRLHNGESSSEAGMAYLQSFLFPIIGCYVHLLDVF